MDSKDMDKSIVCGFLAHPVVYWANLTHYCKRYCDRVGQFAEIQGPYQRTDRQSIDLHVCLKI